MNYFLSTLNYFYVGDIEAAAKYANDTLVEIKSYYGHLEMDFCIESMLILLHGKFDTLPRE